MAAILPDLFLSYGVEDGREVVYVDIDGRDGEFPFDSETDLQIDLFEGGFSALEIRRVMRRLPLARAMYHRPVNDDAYPGTERAASLERPAAAKDAAGCQPAGFHWNFHSAFMAALGVGAATLLCLWLAKALGGGRGAVNDYRFHVRWMIRRDLPEVLAIERGSFEFPWSEVDFIRCLRSRNTIGLVAEFGERVVGFLIYEIHKTRTHVLNIAVHPEWRQRRCGIQLLDFLKNKPQYMRITLEVRETNLDAQLFFKSQGFVAVTVLRSYYEDSPEDAYLFQYRKAPVEATA